MTQSIFLTPANQTSDPEWATLDTIRTNVRHVGSLYVLNVFKEHVIQDRSTGANPNLTETDYERVWQAMHQQAGHLNGTWSTEQNQFLPNE